MLAPGSTRFLAQELMATLQREQEDAHVRDRDRDRDRDSVVLRKKGQKQDSEDHFNSEFTSGAGDGSSGRGKGTDRASVVHDAVMSLYDPCRSGSGLSVDTQETLKGARGQRDKGSH